MKKIEPPPNWQNPELLLQLALNFQNEELQSLIKKINEKYLYWDKVKYKITPDGISHELLWSAVKLNRYASSKKVQFEKYDFSYNLNDWIQKKLHEFDLELGGQLGSKSLIREDSKKAYLVNSIMEEAIASSQIEGAITTRKAAKEMLRKEKSPRSKSEQMIVNNYLTIKHIATIKNEDLTSEKLLEIHRLMTHNTLENPADEGKYRTNNEINVVDAVRGEVVHCPPDYTEISALMQSLFTFFNQNSKGFIHPIVKACIVHFMIGFIHPFVDGNGRTARALFYWYLLKNGYWLAEYLSISRLIIESKEQYAQAFIYTETDNNDLSYFIHYKLKTMSKAYKRLQDYIQLKIKEKKQLHHFQKIKGINERQAQILKWVYEESSLLLTSKEVENRLGISNQTARTDLLKLVKTGYLERIQLDKKSAAFGKSAFFDQKLKR